MYIALLKIKIFSIIDLTVLAKLIVILKCIYYNNEKTGYCLVLNKPKDHLTKYIINDINKIIILLIYS